jgi:hypothetical protein
MSDREFLKCIAFYASEGVTYLNKRNKECKLTFSDLSDISKAIEFDNLHRKNYRLILRPKQQFQEMSFNHFQDKVVSREIRQEIVEYARGTCSIEHVFQEAFRTMFTLHLDVFGLIDEGLAYADEK